MREQSITNEGKMLEYCFRKKHLLVFPLTRKMAHLPMNICNHPYLSSNALNSNLSAPQRTPQKPY